MTTALVASEDQAIAQRLAKPSARRVSFCIPSDRGS